MIGLGHDFRVGLRGLGRRPGLALVAVVTLAIGLGGATTMFGALGVVVTAALPSIPDPERVARLWVNDPAGGLDRVPLKRHEYEALAGGVTRLDAMAAYRDVPAVMMIGDEPVRISVQRVTAGFFDVLGGKPMLGRSNVAAGEHPDTIRTIVVSEAFWRRDLGGGPEVLGRTITIDGQARTIVGVMPAAFGFPAPGTDAWIPLDVRPGIGSPGDAPIYVVGRRRAEATWEQAQAEVTTIGVSVARTAAPGSTRRFRLVPVREEAARRVGLGMFGLMGPALVLLLVACGNVANLLLVRAAERSREMAIRATLGAAPARLARQLLVESATLAAPAGALGLLLAFWGVLLFRRLVSEVSTQFSGLMYLDWRAVVFALVVTLVAPLACGVVPAVHASRSDLSLAMKTGVTAAARRRGHYGFSDLVIFAEVALGVVVVVVSGLLVRFFWELNHLRQGFDSAHVLAVDLPLPETRYANDERITVFYRSAIDRVGAVPGVRRVSVASQAIVWGLQPGRGEPVELERRPDIVTSGRRMAGASAVGTGYFATMGIPIRLGRTFRETDSRSSARVAVVSESAARMFWPGLEPVGQRFRLGRDPTNEPWIEVVGMAGDVMTSTRLPVAPVVYVAFDQTPGRDASLVVRTSVDPISLVAGIKHVIRALDPNLTPELSSIEDRLRRATAGAHITVGSIAVFALLALVLATVGLYSVINHAVSLRTRDIGVRMALGARPLHVVGPIVGRHLNLMVVGFGAGALGTLVVTRLVWRELVMISATDPVMWILLLGVFLSVGLLAATAPARRAMRVDPMAVLRCD